MSCSRLSQAALAAVALTALAACSTGGQRLTRSGFLTDYDTLARVKDHRNVAVYIRPGFQARDYDRVILEPVAWRAPPRPAAVEAELESAFQARLVKQLSMRFQVVTAGAGAPAAGQPDTPPARTLRVRAAITNSRRATWYANVAAQAVSGYGAMMRPSAGGAAEEMEVTDAATGEREVAMATYYNGQFFDVAGSYLTFGHARAAFTYAAEALRVALDAPGHTG